MCTEEADDTPGKRITCCSSTLTFPTNGLPNFEKTPAGTYSAFAVPVSTIVTVVEDADVQPYMSRANLKLSIGHVKLKLSFSASIALSSSTVSFMHIVIQTSVMYNAATPVLTMLDHMRLTNSQPPSARNLLFHTKHVLIYTLQIVAFKLLISTCNFNCTRPR